MKTVLTAIFIIGMIFSMYSQSLSSLDSLIERGEFSKVRNFIAQLSGNTENDAVLKYELSFRLDLMKRILADFRKTEEEVLAFLKRYYPSVSLSMLQKWESAGALEMRVIDGEKKYFNNAARNLFRLDSEAKKVKETVDGITADELDTFLVAYIPSALKEAMNIKSISEPIPITFDYTVALKADAVPPGETVRCWLPFPKESYARQQQVRLLSINSEHYIIAPDSVAQRTVYLEKKAELGKPTIFSMRVSYLASAQFGAAIPGNEGIPEHWLGEKVPHIVFTQEIKELAERLTNGAESDYEKAKNIFIWIDENIPWASALEYSTIPNISTYCLTRKHGDCGIKTLLFMTMCRYLGIPARWQSGWMLHPGSVNLHDWCTIYLQGIGWVPVDQSFGQQNVYDTTHRFFFLGNTDAYHLIINDDYSQPLYPAKIYPRSETVDFQRGELEWRGGNIYFNDWNYSMKVEYLGGTKK